MSGFYASHPFGEHSKPRSPFDWAQGDRGLECSIDFSRLNGQFDVKIVSTLYYLNIFLINKCRIF
ncbi:MAG TPA: hypothetical protein VIE65_18860, partial [Methylobacter sp.]